MKIIGATGHRPNKLGGYSKEVYERLVALAHDYLYQTEPEEVISGMALGWDQAFAEGAMELGIPVIAAIPFRGQETMWPQASQAKYHKILDKCFSEVVVSGFDYAPWKMQKRNEWMVEHSTEMVALWDGTSGGTKNCVKYIEAKKVPWVNLWDKWIAQ